MRKYFVSLLLAASLFAGCAQPKPTQQPLAPGYSSPTDQSMAEVLATARAFYMRLQIRASSGDFKPTAAENQALTDLGASINLAEPLYLAYHAGTGSQAAAQAAVDSVGQKQAAVESQIPAVK